MSRNTPLIVDPFNLQTKSLDIGEAFPETNWKAFLYEGGELNTYNLFIAHFKTIPLIAYAYGIDCKQANTWFLTNYSTLIRYHYQSLTSVYDRVLPRNEDNYYVLYEDLMITFDSHNGMVRLCYRKTELEKINALLEGLKHYFEKNSGREPRISVLVRGSDGISLKKMKLTKPRMNLNDNYNDDFIEVHRIISSRLRKKNDKGLVVLHGKPGTGKTFYIRHLTSTTKKDVIFLPPHLADAITNPDLMGVLINNPNSIFIIEDAENIIVDRDTRGGSPVSTILNIADGLLSDFLHIQIICSFNTDISNIDSALTRKGRLIAKYEFKELTVDKARALSAKLGYDTIIDSPLTLTSIYNQGERDFQPTGKAKIGFKL